MQSELRHYDFSDPASAYAQLAGELGALLAGERDRIANAANTAALIYHALPEVNWVGFYFLRHSPSGDELLVGPFQGQPACVRIPLGRGVCGTAAQTRSTVLVTDVHEFAGHITCDPQSRAEIVLPLLDGPQLLGVLDLDSPRRGRFDEEDRRGLERLAAIFVAACR
jgi:L-methionine (R)-S-oxide reductase